MCDVFVSCDEGFLGQRCECEQQSDADSIVNMLASCRPDNGSLVCSGHGICECGKCVCRGHYSGKFCECDDSSCEHHDGLLCNGKSSGLAQKFIFFFLFYLRFKTHYLHLCAFDIGKGRCKCGTCQCTSNYTGSACECSPSQDKCMNDSMNDIGLCSGQGKCTCNRCQCNEGFKEEHCSAFTDECMLLK